MVNHNIAFSCFAKKKKKKKKKQKEKRKGNLICLTPPKSRASLSAKWRSFAIETDTINSHIDLMSNMGEYP